MQTQSGGKPPYASAPVSSGHATLALTGIGLTLFLPLYFAAHRVRGLRLIGATAAITAIGITLAPYPVGWTVFPIYAAAAIGRARPRQTAFVAIAAIAVVTAAAGFGLSQPTLWWLPGVLLVVTSGSATVSREAFYERAQALLRTQEEVRRLAGTAERERIARDLHDVIGRTLTLVALKADLAGRLVDRDPDRTRRELVAIAGAARGGLAEVRAALAGQSGGSLSHELAASQAALASAGVAIENTGDPGQVADGAGAILAMTLREAVTNVIRHADASQCRFDIACDANGATLSVTDNGRGGSFKEGKGSPACVSGLPRRGATFRSSPIARAHGYVRRCRHDPAVNPHRSGGGSGAGARRDRRPP